MVNLQKIFDTRNILNLSYKDILLYIDKYIVEHKDDIFDKDVYMRDFIDYSIPNSGRVTNDGDGGSSIINVIGVDDDVIYDIHQARFIPHSSFGFKGDLISEGWVDISVHNDGSILAKIEDFEENYNKTLLIYYYGNIKNIGKQAFYNFSSLEFMNLPDSIENIDDFSLCGTDDLDMFSVRLPNSLKRIGDYAFKLSGYNYATYDRVKMNEGLRYRLDYKLPEGLIEIGAGAFCRTNFIETLMIPRSIRIIKEGAFELHDNIKSVINYSEIPNNFVKRAFYAICSVREWMGIQPYIDEIDRLSKENGIMFNYASPNYGYDYDEYDDTDYESEIKTSTMIKEEVRKCNIPLIIKGL